MKLGSKILTGLVGGKVGGGTGLGLQASSMRLRSRSTGLGVRDLSNSTCGGVDLVFLSQCFVALSSSVTFTVSRFPLSLFTSCLAVSLPESELSLEYFSLLLLLDLDWLLVLDLLFAIDLVLDIDLLLDLDLLIDLYLLLDLDLLTLL